MLEPKTCTSSSKLRPQSSKVFNSSFFCLFSIEQDLSNGCETIQSNLTFGIQNLPQEAKWAWTRADWTHQKVIFIG